MGKCEASMMLTAISHEAHHDVIGPSAVDAQSKSRTASLMVEPG